MADDLTPPPGSRTGVIRAVIDPDYTPPTTSIRIEPDLSRLDASIARTGRSLARITAAVHAVAELSGRSSHSQRCPVWLGRAKNVGLDRCNCWIVRDAERVVTTVLAALAQSIEGETDGG